MGGDLDGFRRLRLGLLHEVVDDGLDMDVPLVQDQFLVLQLRDSQQFVDEGQQMLCLFLDDAVVFLLDLGLVIDLAAV